MSRLDYGEMQAAAVQLLGINHGDFWRMSLKEYNALIKAFAQKNDPDGKLREAHQKDLERTPEWWADKLEWLDAQSD